MRRINDLTTNIELFVYYTHQLGSPWCIMLYCGQMMVVVLLTIGKTAEAFSRQPL